MGGRVTNVGLGSYPLVSLAEARKAAFANRRAILKGMDPRGESIPTFRDAAEKVIQLHRENWKPSGSSERQWRQSLEDYAFPKLARKRVDGITSADVLAGTRANLEREATHGREDPQPNRQDHEVGDRGQLPERQPRG